MLGGLGDQRRQHQPAVRINRGVLFHSRGGLAIPDRPVRFQILQRLQRLALLFSLFPMLALFHEFIGLALIRVYPQNKSRSKSIKLYALAMETVNICRRRLFKMKRIRAFTACWVCLLTVVSCGLLLHRDLSAGLTVASAAEGYINLAAGKPYSFSTPPNYAACTDPDDATQLTDGVCTRAYFWRQKSTVGWWGKRPIVVTIDLGKIEPLRGVSYNTAAGDGDVNWPAAVYMLVSDDGRSYYLAGDLVALSDVRQPPPREGYAVHRYWVDTLRTHGRFAQLIIDTGGSYCFVDEIEVYRGEDDWTSLPFPGEPIKDVPSFFQNAAVNTAFKRRLNADLLDVRELLKATRLTPNPAQVLQEESAAIEAAIKQLPPVDPATFWTVLPLNDLHARIFALPAKVRRAGGHPSFEAWTGHPLDYITPSQVPPADSPAGISLIMMRGEWRSAVLNLTSSMDHPFNAVLHVDGLPIGVNPDWVTVRQVVWTDTKELKPIGTALQEAEPKDGGFAVEIPAGMTRQVWFTFHPVAVPAGTYSGRISVTRPGADPIMVPLSLRIFPMIFPEKPTLHVGGWDYTDSTKIFDVTPENRDALVTHLRERFVDSPWGAAAVLPFGTQDAYDPEGNLSKPLDTSHFDRWVARWPGARQYCIFVNAGDSAAGAAMGTPRFNTIVKSWIDFWVNHARTWGLGPAQLVLLLVDEPGENRQDERFLIWARAIRAAQPKLILWEDPVYEKPWEAMPEMMSAANVLCPNRTQLQRGGKAFEDFYRRQKSEGRELCLYSCRGPMHLLDPYSYVRLQAWTAWDMGAESSFFWAFSDAGGGSPWRVYNMPGTNYAPIFLAPDSVTATKHMEALRESVQDYEYFVMLREAVAKADPGHPAVAKARELLATGARRVLEAPNAGRMSWLDPKDRWIAETVRLEILEALAALAK
jgi:hypothetical protein